MKKAIICGLIALIVLATIQFCGPYYVIDREDLVKEVRIGEKYLYSYEWKSADPFHKPIVYTVIIVDIKKKNHTQYVLYKKDKLVYSRPLKAFLKDIRRLDYKYKK